MAQGESHAFGMSSLDLTNHYYAGPDAEQMRFVQYCESRLAESASNDKVSSLAFMQMLEKYCFSQEIENNACRAAENMSFESLPEDVQLAFVNELCSAGPHKERMKCLESLMDKGSEDIDIPLQWKFGICTKTYPLLVMDDGPQSNVGIHVFSTKVGDRDIGVGQTNFDQKSSASAVFDDSGRKKKEGSGPSSKPGVFNKFSSVESVQTDAPTSLPTVSFSQNDKSKKGNKGKKSSQTKAPTAQKTSFPTFRPTFLPSPSPTRSPMLDEVDTGRTSSAEYSSPSQSPSFSPTTMFPTLTGEYTVQSVLDSSIVPIVPPRAKDSSETANRAGIAAVLLGMLFVPVLLFLFVKVYQKKRGSNKDNRDPALLEDFSVISEDSSILVAMGSKFRKSDDLSNSEIGSNGSSIIFVNQAKDLANRIRHAFSRMYEFMEGDDNASLAPIYNSSQSELRREQPVDNHRAGIPRPRVEVFKPKESSSSDESIGILNIDPGTMLLPSDELYIKEFQLSKDESEGSIPIMYQLDDHLIPKKSIRNIKSQSRHPGAVPADEETSQSLRAPNPPTGRPKMLESKEWSDPVPDFTMATDSIKAVRSKAKPLNVDVIRQHTSDDDFRIVGLAYESTPPSDESNGSTSESSTSIPFDEERAPSPRCPSPQRVNTINSRKTLTPVTFEKLSQELDAIMGDPSQPTPVKGGLPSRRSMNSDYNLVSMSSLSQSSVSTFSESTPVVVNSSKWANHTTYAIDVLGEACPPIPQGTDRGRHSLATGSWQRELETSTVVSDVASEAPSIFSGNTRESGVETMLTNDGEVALRSTRSRSKYFHNIV